MKLTFLFLLALLLATTTFNACKKDDVQASDADVVTAEDLSTHEDFDEQVDIDVDLAIEDRSGDCPTVTFDQPEGTWPNTIIVDFGSSCTRPDGRVLRGRLIISQSNNILIAGAARAITYENFYIDDVHIEGTRTLTNNGLNAAGNWSYTKKAIDMKLTFADGSSTTWDKQRTSVLIEGGNTPLVHLDDVWSSTGTASGVNRNGNAFSATVTEPLIKRANCRWISKGSVSLVRGDRSATVDFGNGDCDRLAKLTNAAGDTFTIRLRR